MRISDKKYYEKYLTQIGNKIPGFIKNYDFSENSGGFEYLTKASAVYSSNIEGNSIDLNTFMNYELSKDKFKTGKEIEEIENLIASYEFAQKNKLTEQNLLTCHRILSKTLLIKSKRGKYRIEKVSVFGKSGMAYLAIEPEFVEREMEQFFSEISDLIKKPLTPQEVFYYASIIHLRFVHIHPFRDGNGRVARLIEKWFVVEKLGNKFWKMPSEQYYKENQKIYYEAINLGVNYYELNYDKCLGFLEMLPNCLK
ncbi:MAG: Fic family protein [Candidatus Marinimicrobia bacterium]|nr:Fic family protein [Candidatus Neomarinimicrobiota bacterium]